MFSSPAIHIYSSENAANHVQRKPGSQLKSRKPFFDRPVNGESPFDRKKKSEIPSKKDFNIKQLSPKETPQAVLYDDNLDATDFTYSAKEFEDNYEDIIWPSLLLGKEDIIKILRDYSYPENTPPPSLDNSYEEIKPEFLEIDSDFMELPSTTEEPVFFDEILEVELPENETFEDLDDSI